MKQCIPANDIRAPLRGLRVLLVEDWLPLAVETQHHLEDAGAVVVGPVKRLSKARDLARENSLDAAVLDIDLEGEKVYPLAYDLTKRGVPFVFTSGYASDTIPRDLRHAPAFSKPVDFDALAAALTRLISGRAQG